MSSDIAPVRSWGHRWSAFTCEKGSHTDWNWFSRGPEEIFYLHYWALGQLWAGATWIGFEKVSVSIMQNSVASARWCVWALAFELLILEAFTCVVCLFGHIRGVSWLLLTAARQMLVLMPLHRPNLSGETSPHPVHYRLRVWHPKEASVALREQTLSRWSLRPPSCSAAHVNNFLAGFLFPEATRQWSLKFHRHKHTHHWMLLTSANRTSAHREGLKANASPFWLQVNTLFSVLCRAEFHCIYSQFLWKLQRHALPF